MERSRRKLAAFNKTSLTLFVGMVIVVDGDVRNSFLNNPASDLSIEDCGLEIPV